MKATPIETVQQAHVRPVSFFMALNSFRRTQGGDTPRPTRVKIAIFSVTKQR